MNANHQRLKDEIGQLLSPPPEPAQPAGLPAITMNGTNNYVSMGSITLHARPTGMTSGFAPLS